MRIIFSKLALMGSLIAGTNFAHSEQTFVGDVNKIQVNHYSQGAAYIYIDGAQFNECSNPTNWCAIDFSLAGSNQMYSTVLAAKMSEKELKVVSNGCWSSNYARCWKVILE